MIKRLLTTQLKRSLLEFPAVALLGPRQCGKTTLAKSLSTHYFDLEQPQERLRLDLSWDKLVSNRSLVILDEAQSMPEIFPRLRGAIDAKRKQNGRFLLLGSVAPALMKNVSESLAGRLALHELSPILLAEYRQEKKENELWLRGGFPDGGLLKKKNFPVWQSNYLTLLAQRDLPAWGLPAKPQMTLKFFKMLAIYHGQLWNASTIGASLGLDYHTVNKYLEHLENSYLISALPPYHSNIKKRLIKSPKVYWTDSGLLHSLLGVSDMSSLLSQPWVGASWEGWAIRQILGTLRALGKPFEAYFFRTSDGHEIDLVLNLHKSLMAIEFKLSSSPGIEDINKLNTVADLIRADKRILISRTLQSSQSNNCMSTNISEFIKILPDV